MKYIIGEHFEIAYDPDYVTFTFSLLLPNLNDLQEAYDELFDDRDYEEFVEDLLEGWKQKEFLEYLYDEQSDQFFDEIMQKENRRGTIKDIKVVEDGDRKRLMCWWNPPAWFRSKAKGMDLLDAIVKENILIAIGDRL